MFFQTWPVYDESMTCCASVVVRPIPQRLWILRLHIVKSGWSFTIRSMYTRHSLKGGWMWLGNPLQIVGMLFSMGKIIPGQRGNVYFAMFDCWRLVLNPKKSGRLKPPLSWLTQSIPGCTENTWRSWQATCWPSHSGLKRIVRTGLLLSWSWWSPKKIIHYPRKAIHIPWL